MRWKLEPDSCNRRCSVQGAHVKCLGDLVDRRTLARQPVLNCAPHQLDKAVFLLVLPQLLFKLGRQQVEYFYVASDEFAEFAENLHKGDVIKCAPGVEHWHGATPNSSFTYVAVTPTQKGKIIWLKPVTGWGIQERKMNSISDLPHRVNLSLRKRGNVLSDCCQMVA